LNEDNSGLLLAVRNPGSCFASGIPLLLRNRATKYQATLSIVRQAPSFLITLFLTEQDWQELAMSSKGVGDRRLRIQPDKILHRKVWLPPLEDQKRIEKLFDAYHALKAKHAKIREANQALIPATLERLFASNRNQYV
jgi:hypothetical protein